MSERPDLDICTCGDFRRDHDGGVGGCLLPFCAQHGIPQCRAFEFANAVTESDRLYQESIDARRPLPVSTLLSARQETIHRDPEDCPKSKDGNSHCVHWWDGDDPCCWCGDNTKETEDASTD